MAGKGISSIDGKGRVLIPQSIRDASGIRPSELVVVEYDAASRSIRVSPAHEKRLLHLQIALSDSPGSLAHAAGALAAIGVDLVSTQSRSSKRGEAAVWEVECNPGKNSSSEIRSSLAKSGAKLLSSRWE